jgi:HAD superfamily hydrolase (TIGR01549 family)
MSFPSGDLRGAVLFDLDGTLIDSIYQHALAWYLAFREVGVQLPIWQIHRHVGMGGDQIVPALVGRELDAEVGDRARAAEQQQFARLVDTVAPFDGAHELLATLHDRGYELVLASSSAKEQLDRYLDLLDAHALVASATTADDVESTKPAPDVIELAKARAQARALVMIGDSPWDIAAAARSDLPCVALLTGGYSEQELFDAGAEAVYSSLAAMQREIGSGWLRTRSTA